MEAVFHGHTFSLGEENWTRKLCLIGIMCILWIILVILQTDIRSKKCFLVKTTYGYNLQRNWIPLTEFQPTLGCPKGRHRNIF